MSHNPKDQLLESLSALVDDEANELEVRRLLKQAEESPELMARWQRYQLIGSLMRKEESVILPKQSDFASMIAAQIDGEAAHTLDETRDNRQVNQEPTSSAPQAKGAYWTALGKVSVAASFAVAMIASVNLLNDQRIQDDSSSALAQTTPAADTQLAPSSVSTAPEGFVLPSIGARTVSQSDLQPSAFQVIQKSVAVQPTENLADVETQQMLNEMLLLHAERASVNGGISMLPFARVSKMQNTQ